MFNKLKRNDQKGFLKGHFQRRLNYSSWLLIELLIALLIFTVVGVLFAKYALGGPNSSDITLYANTSMFNIKNSFILNRYTHVFLQKLFLALAKNPVQGLQNYWGFLMGATSFLIYVSARLVKPQANFLNASLAVIIFFSIPVLNVISGIVYVDTTAMFVSTLFLTIYIILLRQKQKANWLLVILGFTFFLAFKTKETLLPWGILFLGFGENDDHRFSMRTLFSNLKWLVAGIFMGILLFVVLNGLLLKDPWFGIRIEDISGYIQSYASGVVAPLETTNNPGWYRGYWFNDLLVSMLFFIISGVLIRNQKSFAHKLVWTMPLILILFILFSINIRFGLSTRFVLPIFPVLSIVGSHFFEFDLPKTRRGILQFGIVFIAGIALIIGIQLLFRWLIPSTGNSLDDFITLIFYPLLLTLFLASIFIIHQKSSGVIASLLLALALLSQPAMTNFRQMFQNKPNHHAFLSVVEPFAIFEEEISFSEEMTFYVVNNVFKGKIPIMKNIDEVLSMFNIYFDVHSVRENFIYVEGENVNYSEILVSNPSLALLTMGDWRSIQNTSNLSESIEEKYRVIVGPDNKYVLLKSYSNQ